MGKRISTTAKCSVDTLIIELTRKCNMACRHCLRGPAQNQDIDKQTIRSLFSRLRAVGTLIFTGGEPSLRPDLMLYALKFAKHYNVAVEHLYLVTNGKQVPDEFLNACQAWDFYCKSCSYPASRLNKNLSPSELTRYLRNLNQDELSEGCIVSLSIDPWHEPITLESVLRLSTLPRLGLDKINKDDRYILNYGNAAKHGIGQLDIQEIRPWCWDERAKRVIWGYKNPESLNDIFGDIVIKTLYINAKGGILTGCDYSYSDQDKFTLCYIQLSNRIDTLWLNRLIREHGQYDQVESVTW